MLVLHIIVSQQLKLHSEPVGQLVTALDSRHKTLAQLQDLSSPGCPNTEPMTRA